MKLKIDTDSWWWGVLLALAIGALVLLLLHFTGGIARAQGPSFYPRPRFEHIYEEYHYNQSEDFNVWYDRETGQEIICTKLYSSGNCYQTGRKW